MTVNTAISIPQLVIITLIDLPCSNQVSRASGTA